VVDQESLVTCDDGKFKEYESGGKYGCYTCPAGTSYAENRCDYSADGTESCAVKCFSEDQRGCVTCPAGKQLLCSDSDVTSEWSEYEPYASACDCYDASAILWNHVPTLVTSSDKVRCFTPSANSPTPTTTPVPKMVAEVAPADSKFFVVMVVTMPYSKAEFDEGKQTKYKAAIASTAGSPVENVDIVSITEMRRRAGSVEVETKVRKV
jgi:hypothetical protein